MNYEIVRDKWVRCTELAEPLAASLEYCKVNLPKETLQHYDHYFKNEKGVFLDANESGVFGDILMYNVFGFSTTEYLTQRPRYRGDNGVDIIIDGLKYDLKTQISDWLYPTACHRFDVSSETVAKHSHEIDGYIWGRTDFPGKNFLLYGYMDKDEFLSKATRLKTGDPDPLYPHSPYRYKFPAHMVHLPELKPFTDLLNRKYTIPHGGPK